MDGKIFFAEILKTKRSDESMDAFAARAGTHKSALYNWRRGVEVTSAKVQEVLTKLGFSENERTQVFLKILDPLYERVDASWTMQDLKKLLEEKDEEIDRLKREIERLKRHRR